MISILRKAVRISLPPNACKVARKIPLEIDLIPRKIEGEVLTGELIHWRYIVPCLLDNMVSGRMSEQKQDEVRAFLRHYKQPDRGFLESYFPVPTDALYKTGYDKLGCQSENDVWSLVTVRRFWHVHEGHSPDCAVKRLTVFTSMPAKRFISPVTGTEQAVVAGLDGSRLDSPLLDLYELGPHHCQSVRTHRSVIIETE